MIRLYVNMVPRTKGGGCFPDGRGLCLLSMDGKNQPLLKAGKNRTDTQALPMTPYTRPCFSKFFWQFFWKVTHCIAHRQALANILDNCQPDLLLRSTPPWDDCCDANVQPLDILDTIIYIYISPSTKLLLYTRVRKILESIQIFHKYQISYM